MKGWTTKSAVVTKKIDRKFNGATVRALARCFKVFPDRILKSGLIREDSNQHRDREPQQALNQKEQEAPEAQLFDPTLEVHFISSI